MGMRDSSSRTPRNDNLNPTASAPERRDSRERPPEAQGVRCGQADFLPLPARRLLANRLLFTAHFRQLLADH